MLLCSDLQILEYVLELKKAILKQQRYSVTNDRIKAWVSVFFYQICGAEKIVTKQFLTSSSEGKEGWREGHSLTDLPVAQGGEGVYLTETFNKNKIRERNLFDQSV